MKVVIIFWALTSTAWAFPLIPNSSFTYGAYCTRADIHFDGVRYLDKVPHCRRAVYESTKQMVYNAYGIPMFERPQYTIDHLIPLSLGGANNIYNLWPQHKSISTANLEGAVYREIVKGKIRINQAINIILSKKYGRTK